jgi:hypothetical protein
MSDRAPSQKHIVKGAAATSVGVMAVAFFLAHPTDALAQNALRGLLDLPPAEGRGAPGAERYQTPDGRLSFVLDRSGERLALIRFEGSDEVHVLHAVPGPRGDEFFKTDTGDVLLRVTALGSVIVYADPASTGAPAQMAGRIAPMEPPQAPEGGLKARFDALAREVAKRFGRPVEFEAPSDARGAGVVADAAQRAAEGLAQAPQTVVVRRVIIRYGDQPGAFVSDEKLTITVAPQMGYAGRPSSAAIQRAFNVNDKRQEKR